MIVKYSGQRFEPHLNLMSLSKQYFALKKEIKDMFF